MSTRTKMKQYVLLDNHDDQVTYGWDEDADILFMELMDRKSKDSTINDEMTKITWYDQEGLPTGIDLLYCSMGINLDDMDDVPETLHAHLQAVAKALKIDLKTDLKEPAAG